MRICTLRFPRHPARLCHGLTLHRITASAHCTSRSGISTLAVRTRRGWVAIIRATLSALGGTAYSDHVCSIHRFVVSHHFIKIAIADDHLPNRRKRLR